MLSTCNRFEIFGSLSPENSLDSTVKFFRDAGVSRAMHSLAGRAAAERLYRIVCGLDSMVLGRVADHRPGGRGLRGRPGRAARRAVHDRACSRAPSAPGRRARRETEIGQQRVEHQRCRGRACAGKHR